jgi:hypothetical protein
MLGKWTNDGLKSKSNLIPDVLIRTVLNDIDDDGNGGIELATSEKIRDNFKLWTKKLLQLVALHTTTSTSNPSSEVSCRQWLSSVCNQKKKENY